MEAKLTKAQRERIIFNHLKGIEDPLYEVSETKYGKWLVKPKHIEIEEEEERPEEQPPQPQAPKPKLEEFDRNAARRERRKRNRRAKQDAKKILDALTNLINSNNESDSSDNGDTEERQRAPPLVEAPNFHPQQLSFRRRRLAF